MDPFGTEEEKKVHRFTNNLQGLQKVIVKDFSWNLSPWNALLFEKTAKQYKLDIVFVETNTRCSAIVGSVFESMKKCC